AVGTLLLELWASAAIIGARSPILVAASSAGAGSPTSCSTSAPRRSRAPARRPGAQPRRLRRALRGARPSAAAAIAGAKLDELGGAPRSPCRHRCTQASRVLPRQQI